MVTYNSNPRVPLGSLDAPPPRVEAIPLKTTKSQPPPPRITSKQQSPQLFFTLLDQHSTQVQGQPAENSLRWTHDENMYKSEEFISACKLWNEMYKLNRQVLST